MRDALRQPEQQTSQTGGQIRASAEGLGAVIWRQKWLILATVAAALGAGGVFLVLSDAEYASTARVHVASRSRAVMDGQDAPAALPATFLPTQIELIRSESILQEAIDRLGRENLESLRQSDRPIEDLQAMLQVETPARNDLINVTVRSRWPEEAARLAGAITQTYLERKQQEQNQTLDGLLEQRRVRQERLEADLQALSDFQNAHGRSDLDPEAGAAVINDQLTQLNRARNEAELRLVDAKFQYELSLQVAEDPDKLRQAILARDEGAALPEAAREYYLTKELEAAHARIDTLKQHYTPDHPALVAARQELRGVEQRIDDLKGKMAEGFVAVAKNRYELARQRMAEIEHALAAQKEQALQRQSIASQFALLKDQVERSRKQLDKVADRIGQLEADGQNTSLVAYKLIQQARPPRKPAWPDPARVMILAGAIGLALGLTLALVLDWSNRGYRCGTEVGDKLNLPVLTTVPRVPGRLETDMVGQRYRLNPAGPVAEAIRILRTSMHFATARGKYKSLLITSPASGDGKSVIAANLAISLAETGNKVLLLDADLYNPTQHEIFGVGDPDKSPAESSGKVPSLERLLTRATGIANLDVVAGGTLLQAALDVLGDDGFEYILRRLGKFYDKIIIDAPPALPVAQARGLSVIADRTLLVFRPDRSQRGQVELACRTLTSLGATIMGLVINGVKLGSGGSYYGIQKYLSRRRGKNRKTGQGNKPAHTGRWK